MINEGQWVILDNFQDLYTSGVNDCTTFKSNGKRLGAAEIKKEMKSQRDRLRSLTEKKQNQNGNPGHYITLKQIMVKQ